MRIGCVCVVVVATASMVAGCGAGSPADDPSEVVAALGDGIIDPVECPDDDCTVSNGTGVYQEEGSPRIGETIPLTITHFINTGTSVKVHGRYQHPSGRWAGKWSTLPTPGRVYGAQYDGKTGYQVLSVRETGTYPTWTLLDPAHGERIEVSGPDLIHLALYVTFSEPLTPLLAYVLDFTNQAIDPATGGETVYKYNLRWRAVADRHGASKQYCVDSRGLPDSVVFQGGIDVNAVTGAITRDATTANHVTVSCRLGAPATAYAWGYDYRSSDSSWYFDAAIQMKRASYCADGAYYTKVGTQILIADAARIQHDRIVPGLAEAYWTPKGAACLGTRRHPEIAFSGSCNGIKLEPCPESLSAVADGPGSGPWLVDAVSSTDGVGHP